MNFGTRAFTSSYQNCGEQAWGGGGVVVVEDHVARHCVWYVISTLFFVKLESIHNY